VYQFTIQVSMSVPSFPRAIAAGSPAFKRINRAMVFGGFSTFALLYCVQPLMPLLARQFALTPAQSSLVLSVSTAALAISLLLSSVVSDRIGRKPMMVAAMLGGAVLTLASAFAQNFAQLLVLRGLLGVALGGMPAVAMAYLGEEIEGPSLGLSMGLYIGGSAFGGMLGRVLTSVVSDFYSWRVAIALMGAAGLYSAWEFRRSLPVSNNFKGTDAAHQRGVAALLEGVRGHLSDRGLPWLFALAFLLMGCFVSLYNYIGYRLLGAPFALSQSGVGLLSALYLLGIFSSVWAGRLADRLGRRNVLWLFMSVMLSGLLLTLANWLPAIVLGMGLFTFGFFASHSVASSWVGRRAQAPKALASALYLFFYYLGSSVIGSFCGVLWSSAGWPGVVGLLGAALGIGFVIALRLRSLVPLPLVPLTPVA
jgi:YNFM family putative membrane transporter